MLLLVVQAELDDRAERLAAAVAAREQLEHVAIDVGAVGQHLVERRPGEQAAARPRMLRADLLIVRVEQDANSGWKRPIAGDRRCSSTKVSKNQLVCARCHFVGLASSIDCAWQSSADSGPRRRSVSPRTSR